MVRKRYDVAPKFNVKDEGVLIQQQAGSTANLLEIKDSSNNTLMSISNTGSMTTSVTPSFTDISINGSAIIMGDLTVNGNTVTLNAETLIVEDKNIVLANVTSASNTTADGAGVTINAGVGGNKTFNFVNLTSSWRSSENIDIPTGKTYKINNTDVVTATTLGSSVINSSLTSVGTLGNLTVSGNTTLSANTSIGSVSSTELSYVDGVTSAIQTQLNARSLASTTGLVKLAQVNLASNYGFTSAFSAAYRNYYIIMEYVQFPGATEIYFRLMSGGAVEQSANYYKTRLYVQGNGTPGGTYLSADSYGRVGYGGTVASTYWIHLSSPNISGVHKMFTSHGVYSDTAARGFIEQNHCQVTVTGQYDGITLAGNSYGFSAGVATLYGELA